MEIPELLRVDWKSRFVTAFLDLNPNHRETGLQKLKAIDFNNKDALLCAYRLSRWPKTLYTLCCEIVDRDDVGVVWDSGVSLLSVYCKIGQERTIAYIRRNWHRVSLGAFVDWMRSLYVFVGHNCNSTGSMIISQSMSHDLIDILRARSPEIMENPLLLNRNLFEHIIYGDRLSAYDYDVIYQSPARYLVEVLVNMCILSRRYDVIQDMLIEYRQRSSQTDVPPEIRSQYARVTRLYYSACKIQRTWRSILERKKLIISIVRICYKLGYSPQIAYVICRNSG